ncbi:MAG TPA: DegV family protein [Peptococcaceae bacterium]|nr:DegV family protein [Peptococcaceae bacterium]
MAIRIVVDSSSDIPKNISKDLGIVTVPMPVYIDGNLFHEGVDLFTDEFYANFKNYKDLPKTSQPSPNILKDIYEKVLAEGHDVIAIHLSSGLSSTYQTAVMVRDICSAPERIHLIDSLGASLGFGLQAILACRLASKYENAADLVKHILEIRDKMRYIFTLDTLEYLVKGGRISKTAGFVAGLLDVKPILHINPQGKIDVLSKVRSRKAALRKLVEIMEQNITEPENQIIGISHAACLEEAKDLAAEIRNKLPIREIIIGEIGSVVGSHVGPGTLALFFQKA